MHLERLGDAVADAEQRVERRGRILRHDADPTPQPRSSERPPSRGRHRSPRSDRHRPGAARGPRVPASTCRSPTHRRHRAPARARLRGSGRAGHGSAGRPSRPGIVDARLPERQHGRRRGCCRRWCAARSWVRLSRQPRHRASRCRVYSVNGAVNSDTTSPRSTMRPLRMTSTSSARSATTPMLWVISRIAVPSRSRRSPSRSQDLGLDGDVERSGRLVGDQEHGVVRQGHGDDDALLLPAGQLMRIGVDTPFRFGDADQREQLDRALPGRPSPDPPVGTQRFGELPAHGLDRVQCGLRLLEHHGRGTAPERRPTGRLAGTHRSGSVSAPAARWVVGQLHRPGRGRRRPAAVRASRAPDRLPGAGLPHQGKDLPASDAERHGVHRHGRDEPDADSSTRSTASGRIGRGPPARCGYAGSTGLSHRCSLLRPRHGLVRLGVGCGRAGDVPHGVEHSGVRVAAVAPR